MFVALAIFYGNCLFVGVKNMLTETVSGDGDTSGSPAPNSEPAWSTHQECLSLQAAGGKGWKDLPCRGREVKSALPDFSLSQRPR